MNIKTGEELHGFILENSEKIDDIKSEGYIFRHEKSGARLMYIENDDDNKVFFIAFKTPPDGDFGTPHIIEHSVLCGSDKYPVKDPFNEMAKGSLNTYLNALTYSDKTVYPVASRNDKDFRNLMDVYMDAVFRPLILKNKKLFMQEGHHLHMEDINDPLEIKGVVYNEMKGAYSDPDRYLDSAVNTALFTDSPYRFESGGDPDKIPELTYEAFIDFYKKYYHPSNSYIYLYGKMDIDERMEYLDREYLSGYDKQVFNNDIKHQKDQNAVIRKNEYYPVFTGTGRDGMYAAGFITGDSCDEENSLACSVLSYILMDTNASPIRKALTEGGFCDYAEGWYDPSMLDTVFTIAAKSAKENAGDEFESIVTKGLSDCVKNGLDRDLVRSAVNAFDFMLSEEDFGYKPRGLYYGLKAMNIWLHKDEPVEGFKFKKYISIIREKAENGLFEKLIEEKMLNNPTKVFVSLQPKEGMQAESDAEEKERLEKYKNGLSEEKKENIVKETKDLLEYQAGPDDLSVIPGLVLDDIKKKAEEIDGEEKNGVYYVPGETNGIVYAQLLFSADHISENDYGYLGLLSDLIGKLDTQKLGYTDLPTQIDMYTGGITSSCQAYVGNDGVTRRYLAVETKALSGNINELLEITDQTVNKMLFDKTESIRLIIKDRISKLENQLTQNGHSAASTRALSHINSAYAFKDASGGIGYFRFLLGIDANFSDGVVNKLKEIAGSVFASEKLTAGISCEEKDIDMASAIAGIFPEKSGKYTPDTAERKTFLSEGVITPGKVQYVAKAADYGKAGYEYGGKLLVLKNIIDLEYLWNMVRVQGGAYGCGCSFLRSGSMYMYSYRDPNLSSTIEIYDKTSEFLKNFDADEKAMTGYIIGAINSLDRPLSKEQRLRTALARHINGIGKEFLQKERDGVLSVTAEDIRNFADMLGAFSQSGDICVVGSEDNIMKEKDKFENVFPLK